MATTTNLIADVTTTSCISQPKLKGYVNELRHAGLIGHTYRGGKALAVTTSDAAALYAATLVRPTIRQAAEATQIALSLPLQQAYIESSVNNRVRRISLSSQLAKKAIPYISTFGDLLLFLLELGISFCSSANPHAKKWRRFFVHKKYTFKIVYYGWNTDLAYIAFRLSRTRTLFVQYCALTTCGLETPDPEETARAMSGYDAVYATMTAAPNILVYATSLRKRLSLKPDLSRTTHDP